MASPSVPNSSRLTENEDPASSQNTDRRESEDDGDKSNSDENKNSNAGNFECNICLDTAKDAVVSVCGHLFCWPCLHQWLELRPHNKTCPVCKAAVSRDKVIPLYGRGADSTKDPRNKAPPRPQGQRTEPEPQHSFMNGFGFGGDGAGGGGGFQFHFGIGAFPFGFFTLMNNGFNGGGQAQLPPGQSADDRFLSCVFIAMAVFFLMWLLFV